MRCNDVHELIFGGSLTAPAQEHLDACPQCRALAREAESLNAGFALLAQDAVPEPSWGFASRVLRGLNEAPSRMLEPLEIIGRRAVLVAGALAMTVMMALALSSSGPLRGERTGTFALSSVESTETAETLLAGGVDENEEINLLPVNVNGGDSR
jgi:hypothetical protein